jgi:hypothetical protein
MIGEAGLSDESWQIAVLSYVLLEHPAFLSVDELRREMVADCRDFSESDAHDRAVRDLVAAGLLRCDGDSILPTRAAVRFNALQTETTHLA